MDGDFARTMFGLFSAELRTMLLVEFGVPPQRAIPVDREFAVALRQSSGDWVWTSVDRAPAGTRFYFVRDSGLNRPSFE